MKTVTAKFVQVKTTPGAILYKEVDQNDVIYEAPNAPGCKIGQLYIRKTCVGSSRFPTKITVSVEWEE